MSDRQDPERRRLLGDKAAMRARIRAARAGLAEETVRRRADSLAEHVACHLLGRDPAADPSVLLIGYLPMPGEPDLRPTMAGHLDRDGEVLVPRILGGRDRLLDWVAWRPGVETRRSAYAPVEEPVGPSTDLVDRLVRPDARAVLLVPALAVDDDGARLGQGGGYYDRLIDRLRRQVPAVPEIWAVVHADEVLPAGAFPVEAHDLRASRILTEDGIESIGA